MLPRRRMPTIAVACIVCVSLPLAAGDLRYPTATHGRGELRYVNDLPVMVLQGGPQEIGEQQAALAGAAVRPLLRMPKKVTEALGHGKAWPLAVGVSGILIANGPERFRQELDALIKAGDLDMGTLYVANALVELRRMGGCSTFIVTPERSTSGEMLFGRNFDFPPLEVLDKFSCVFIVRPEDRHAFVSIGYPGMIGVVSGMNDAGLAVATLDVYSSADGSPMFNPQGVPLALTFRRILEECTTVAEAETLLKETPRTTWMNLAVSDAKTAAVFEITPHTVGVRGPEDAVLACTNHFRCDNLRTDVRCRRYNAFAKLSADGSSRFGVAEVQQALHAANQGEMTLHTMVFEPEALRLHLAIGAGPVSDDPLKTLELREWFGR